MPTSVPELAASRPEPLLALESLASGYGSGLIVRSVELRAGSGEVVTIVGPNGSGKSTLLKTIAGLVEVSAGRVLHDGTDISALSAERRARRGIAYVPQEHEVFSSLSVKENLLLGGYGLGRSELAAALERVYATYEILPKLEKATAGRLSGGERKTLAMGRVLMSSPSLVLLDEPTSNLAPIPTARLLEVDVPALAATGAAVVLVEQRALQAIAAADWVYLLVAGEVAMQGTAADIGSREDIGRMFLGGSGRRQRSEDGN